MSIITDVRTLSQSTAQAVQVVQPVTQSGTDDMLKYLDKAESILKVVDSIVSKSDVLKGVLQKISEKKQPVESARDTTNPIYAEKVEQRDSGRPVVREAGSTIVKEVEKEVIKMKAITAETVGAYLDVLSEQLEKVSPEWKEKTLSGFIQMYKESGTIKKAFMCDHVANIVNKLIEEQ
jgi:chaperonin cofactor prefoldin